LSVQITKGAAPLAFPLAGLVALLTARSYALLPKAYPPRRAVSQPNRAQLTKGCPIRSALGF
jgi:hypothetical protein